MNRRPMSEIENIVKTVNVLLKTELFDSIQNPFPPKTKNQVFQFFKNNYISNIIHNYIYLKRIILFKNRTKDYAESLNSGAKLLLKIKPPRRDALELSRLWNFEAKICNLVFKELRSKEQKKDYARYLLFLVTRYILHNIFKIKNKECIEIIAFLNVYFGLSTSVCSYRKNMKSHLSPVSYENNAIVIKKRRSNRKHKGDYNCPPYFHCSPFDYQNKCMADTICKKEINCITTSLKRCRKLFPKKYDEEIIKILNELCKKQKENLEKFNVLDLRKLIRKLKYSKEKQRALYLRLCQDFDFCATLNNPSKK